MTYNKNSEVLLMVIRHSLLLLEQLHELERQIQKWEHFAHEKGIPLESEDILRLALLELTRGKQVS
jgi:hypothetical protein